jgi:hypothetical protein
VSPTSSRLLRISTESLPERERFSAFREVLARRVLKMDVIDHSNGCPRIEVTIMRLGPVLPRQRSLCVANTTSSMAVTILA